MMHSPMSQAFITTSWDDGHPSDMRLADMLARHGLTGTFYIPRAIETGVMPTADIRSLSSNFEIGAHTLNHVFLANTNDATARAEIAGSKAWVEDITGQPCPMFCPPAGRYKSRHLPMFRDAGYTGIRTVEFLSLDLPRPRGGILEMPTTLQAFPHPPVNYLKNLTKRGAVANFWLYARHGRSRNWAVLARRLLLRTLRVGGIFHLWGHSWELDQAGLWPCLEDVLTMLDEVRDQAPCLTNGQICRQQRRQARGGTSEEVREARDVRVGEGSASASATATASPTTVQPPPPPPQQQRHLLRD
jgi:peptidoglycan-N-acetylglucosamine deacetylase